MNTQEIVRMQIFTALLVIKHFLYTEAFLENLINFDIIKTYIPRPIPQIVKEALSGPTDMIKEYGYPFQNEIVVTRDGYRLTTIRIPYGKGGNENKSRVPILLFHALNCASTQWVDSGPRSLAFILADQGYDVWIANLRGSRLNSHEKYRHNMKEYWNYTLDDVALVDLPLIIDDILNKTGHNKIFYVGHSIGTVVAFALLAGKPSYNEKIAGYIALAPFVQLKYANVIFLKYFLRHRNLLNLINMILTTLNPFEWGSSNPTVTKLVPLFCPSENPAFCSLGLYLTGGFDPYLRDQIRTPIYTTHCSHGESTYVLAQIIYSTIRGNLSRFDFGYSKNIEVYGSGSPPLYNLSKITVPIVLFYAANDIAATPFDVVLLRKRLRNVVSLELFPFPMAIHSDFMWASNAKELIYDKILQYLNGFLKNK